MTKIEEHALKLIGKTLFYGRCTKQKQQLMLIP